MAALSARVIRDPTPDAGCATPCWDVLRKREQIDVDEPEDCNDTKDEPLDFEGAAFLVHSQLFCPD